jgi:hypothetical protein
MPQRLLLIGPELANIVETLTSVAAELEGTRELTTLMRLRRNLCWNSQSSKNWWPCTSFQRLQLSHRPSRCKSCRNCRHSNSWRREVIPLVVHSSFQWLIRLLRSRKKVLETTRRHSSASTSSHRKSNMQRRNSSGMRLIKGQKRLL